MLHNKRYREDIHDLRNVAKELNESLYCLQLAMIESNIPNAERGFPNEHPVLAIYRTDKTRNEANEKRPNTK